MCQGIFPTVADLNYNSERVFSKLEKKKPSIFRLLLIRVIEHTSRFAWDSFAFWKCIDPHLSLAGIFLNVRGNISCTIIFIKITVSFFKSRYLKQMNVVERPNEKQIIIFFH